MLWWLNNPRLLSLVDAYVVWGSTPREQAASCENVRVLLRSPSWLLRTLWESPGLLLDSRVLTLGLASGLGIQWLLLLEEYCCLVLLLVSRVSKEGKKTLSPCANRGTSGVAVIFLKGCLGNGYCKVLIIWRKSKK